MLEVLNNVAELHFMQMHAFSDKKSYISRKISRYKISLEKASNFRLSNQHSLLELPESGKSFFSLVSG